MINSYKSLKEAENLLNKYASSCLGFHEIRQAIEFARGPMGDGLRLIGSKEIGNGHKVIRRRIALVAGDDWGVRNHGVKIPMSERILDEIADVCMEELQELYEEVKSIGLVVPPPTRLLEEESEENPIGYAPFWRGEKE